MKFSNTIISLCVVVSICLTVNSFSIQHRRSVSDDGDDEDLLTGYSYIHESTTPEPLYEPSWHEDSMNSNEGTQSQESERPWRKRLGLMSTAHQDELSEHDDGRHPHEHGRPDVFGAFDLTASSKMEATGLLLMNDVDEVADQESDKTSLEDYRDDSFGPEYYPASATAPLADQRPVHEDFSLASLGSLTEPGGEAEVGHALASNTQEHMHRLSRSVEQEGEDHLDGQDGELGHGLSQTEAENLLHWLRAYRQKAHDVAGETQDSDTEQGTTPVSRLESTLQYALLKAYDDVNTDEHTEASIPILEAEQLRNARVEVPGEHRRDAEQVLLQPGRQAVLHDEFKIEVPVSELDIGEEPIQGQQHPGSVTQATRSKRSAADATDDSLLQTADDGEGGMSSDDDDADESDNDFSPDVQGETPLILDPRTESGIIIDTEDDGTDGDNADDNGIHEDDTGYTGDMPQVDYESENNDDITVREIGDDSYIGDDSDMADMDNGMENHSDADIYVIDDADSAEYDTVEVDDGLDDHADPPDSDEPLRAERSQNSQQLTRNLWLDQHQLSHAIGHNNQQNHPLSRDNQQLSHLSDQDHQQPRLPLHDSHRLNYPTENNNQGVRPRPGAHPAVDNAQQNPAGNGRQPGPRPAFLVPPPRRPSSLKELNEWAKNEWRNNLRDEYRDRLQKQNATSSQSRPGQRPQETRPSPSRPRPGQLPEESTPSASRPRPGQLPGPRPSSLRPGPGQLPAEPPPSVHLPHPEEPRPSARPTRPGPQPRPSSGPTRPEQRPDLRPFITRPLHEQLSQRPRPNEVQSPRPGQGHDEHLVNDELNDIANTPQTNEEPETVKEEELINDAVVSNHPFPGIENEAADEPSGLAGLLATTPSWLGVLGELVTKTVETNILSYVGQQNNSTLTGQDQEQMDPQHDSTGGEDTIGKKPSKKVSSTNTGSNVTTSPAPVETSPAMTRAGGTSAQPTTQSHVTPTTAGVTQPHSSTAASSSVATPSQSTTTVSTANPHASTRPVGFDATTNAVSTTMKDAVTQTTRTPSSGHSMPPVSTTNSPARRTPTTAAASSAGSTPQQTTAKSTASVSTAASTTQHPHGSTTLHSAQTTTHATEHPHVEVSTTMNTGKRATVGGSDVVQSRTDSSPVPEPTAAELIATYAGSILASTTAAVEAAVAALVQTTAGTTPAMQAGTTTPTAIQVETTVAAGTTVAPQTCTHPRAISGQHMYSEVESQRVQHVGQGPMTETFQFSYLTDADRGYNELQALETIFDHPTLVTHAIVDTEAYTWNDVATTVTRFWLEVQSAEDGKWRIMRDKDRLTKIFQLDIEGSGMQPLYIEFEPAVRVTGIRLYPEDWRHKPTIKLDWLGCAAPAN